MKDKPSLRSDPALMRRYKLEYIQKRRRAWFATNGPCKACSSWDSLELDHIIPESKIHHQVWSWAEKRRLEELSKCQALCRSCHIKKSSREQKERKTGKPILAARKYQKEFVFQILHDYFLKGLSRRGIAKKYNISQGTVSSWIYADTLKVNCTDWLKEFKERHLLGSGRKDRRRSVKSEQAGALPASLATSRHK